jgi:hypothetical protein
MKRRHKDTNGVIREYSVADCKCKKRKCFVPFSGNGQPICRLYELGQCPNDPDNYKKD